MSKYINFLRFDAIGLAAIQISLAYGLEVFTTCCTDDQRNYLLNRFSKLKSKNIFLTNNAYSYDILWKGQELDIYLNSVHEPKGFEEYLSGEGAFIDIANIDLKNISKKNIIRPFASKMFLNDFETNKIRVLISNDIENGVIEPLKSTLFVAENINKAVKSHMSDEVIGKVVLKIDESIKYISKIYFNSRKTYKMIYNQQVETFALEFLHWIILKGARKIFIYSETNSIFENFRIS